MIKERMKKFIFSHPDILNTIKLLISNKYLANNSLYKYLVMKRAERLAWETREYKEAIYIETVLNCNSRCIFCAHHNKLMEGTMTRELYEKIIDECHDYGINKVILSIYGEFLLDKYLFQRIKYLRKYGMTYGFVTNASLLTPEKTDRLLQLGGLTYINFSVNGFSKEVYEKTMIGLKRDTVYRHIHYFLQQKEKLKHDDIVVNISAVKTNINSRDYREFFKYWRMQKGIDTLLPVELIDRMGKEYNGEIGKLGPMTKKTNWLSPCRSLWASLMVYYDGKVGPCCKDNDKREIIVGDATKQTVKEISTGADLKNLRQSHLAGKRKNHPVCGKCYLNSVWFGQ